MKLSQTSTGTGINAVEPSTSSSEHYSGNGNGQGFQTHLLLEVSYCILFDRNHHKLFHTAITFSPPMHILIHTHPLQPILSYSHSYLHLTEIHFFPFQGQQGYQSSPKSKLSPRYGDHHSLSGSHNRSFDHRPNGTESSQSHIRPTIDTMMMQQQQQRNALNGNGNGNNSNLNSPGNTVQSSLSPDTHYSQPRGRGRPVSRGRDGRLYSRDSSTGGHGGAFSETGTTTSNTTRPHRSYSAPRSRYLRSSSKENFGYNKGLTPRNVAYDERWRARSKSPPHRHFSPSLLAKSANERILSTSRENETFETRLNRSISNYYIRQVLNPTLTLTPNYYISHSQNLDYITYQPES